MKMFAGRLLSVRVGALAVLVALAGIGAAYVAAQNPSLAPTFGSVTLNSGFLPDPVVRNVVAGGTIQTNLGGVNTHVANAPDFRLYYTAGKLPLTIHVESAADTTLLINLPDGTWVADDDSGGNLNPLLKFARPQSGRYDIYVGTFAKGTAPQAALHITERR